MIYKYLHKNVEITYLYYRSNITLSLFIKNEIFYTKMYTIVLYNTATAKYFQTLSLTTNNT